MLKIAVMGSGKGSNFQAIMHAINDGRIPNAQVVLVISNNSKAGILEIGRSWGIPSIHLSTQECGSEEKFIGNLLDALQKHEVNCVVLAGYMKRIPHKVIAAYRNRILNIHPALLPRHGGKGMYGMHVHESVIASGDHVSGATVHLVDEEYDRGKILLQREVPVSKDETPESLATKVLAVEHLIYPEAIRLFAKGNASAMNDTGKKEN